MKFSTLVFNGAALALGVTVGYWLNSGPLAPTPAPTSAPTSAPKIADARVAASERVLSTRIRELESLYRAAPVPEKSSQEEDSSYWQPLVTQNGDGSVTFSISLMSGPPTFDVKAKMEELRKTDPEEFKRRAQFYREMGDGVADDFDERIEFFDQLDISWMDEAQRIDFKQLIEKMKCASDCWRRGGHWELPLDQRKVVEAYKFRVSPSLPNEYPRVRGMLLNRTAELMGLDDASTSDFLAMVNTVERMTSRYTVVTLP